MLVVRLVELLSARLSREINGQHYFLHHHIGMLHTLYGYEGVSQIVLLFDDGTDCCIED